MLDAHVSQMYEWLPWVAGSLENVPKDAPLAPRDARRSAVVRCPCRSRQVVRARPGKGGALRRGLRDLRVRRAPGRSDDPEAVSIPAERSVARTR